MLGRFFRILVCRVSTDHSVFRRIRGSALTFLELIIPFVLLLVIIFGLQLLVICHRLGRHVLLSVYFPVRTKGATGCVCTRADGKGL